MANIFSQAPLVWKLFPQIWKGPQVSRNVSNGAKGTAPVTLIASCVFDRTLKKGIVFLQIFKVSDYMCNPIFNRPACLLVKSISHNVPLSVWAKVHDSPFSNLFQKMLSFSIRLKGRKKSEIKSSGSRTNHLRI